MFVSAERTPPAPNLTKPDVPTVGSFTSPVMVVAVVALPPMLIRFVAVVVELTPRLIV